MEQSSCFGGGSGGGGNLGYSSGGGGGAVVAAAVVLSVHQSSELLLLLLLLGALGFGGRRKSSAVGWFWLLSSANFPSSWGVLLVGRGVPLFASRGGWARGGDAVDMMMMMWQELLLQRSESTPLAGVGNVCGDGVGDVCGDGGMVWVAVVMVGW